MVAIPVTVEQGWVGASEAFEFSESSIFAIELRGREPNCKVSHIYFGTGNPGDAAVYEESAEAFRIRQGCRSTLSPRLRRCNFNVEVTKAVTIEGVAPEETIVDCGTGSFETFLPRFSLPRRGFKVNAAAVLKNVGIRHCRATWHHPNIHVENYHGGAIYFDKEMNDQEFFSLENVVIRDCAADTAGGIAVQSGNLNSVNVSIFDTFAGPWEAVFCQGGGSVVWTGGILKGNVAIGDPVNNVWGGTFEVGGGSAVLRHTTFLENQNQHGFGAGIHTNVPIVVEDCTFEGNRAARGGHDITYTTYDSNEERSIVLTK